jgi:hypothetical protein
MSVRHQKSSAEGNFYLLDSQAHARASRKGNQPVVQVGGIKPAFWNEVLWLGK